MYMQNKGNVCSVRNLRNKTNMLVHKIIIIATFDKNMQKNGDVSKRNGWCAFASWPSDKMGRLMYGVIKMTSNVLRKLKYISHSITYIYLCIKTCNRVLVNSIMKMKSFGSVS